MMSDLRNNPVRRAFTLIELIIVIGVIVLLVTITLTVGSIVIENSERRNAEAAMTVMAEAVDAWEATRERPLTFGIDEDGDYTGPGSGPYYSVNADGFELDGDFGDDLEDLAAQLTTRALQVLADSPESKELLARMDPKRLRALDMNEPDYEDDVFKQRLTDPWDGPILVVFPGREWSDLLFAAADGSTTADLDGTIRTDVEERIGVARERRIAFVSAGPDGFFGDRQAATDSVEYQRTLDNIYSYELDEPGS